ncbi:hypothetical protein L6452_09917 [Arctium lappa]|uniref:Uncharacterized protein n=1 Tax=Arctium lappa TaxID=4217 RepID=A0ACB9DM19_ARCLA|nr:hypothetical protein L6452_09917 [Arctium lappa]
MRLLVHCVKKLVPSIYDESSSRHIACCASPTPFLPLLSPLKPLIKTLVFNCLSVQNVRLQIPLSPSPMQLIFIFTLLHFHLFKFSFSAQEEASC